MQYAYNNDRGCFYSSLAVATLCGAVEARSARLGVLRAPMEYSDILGAHFICRIHFDVEVAELVKILTTFAIFSI